MSIDYKIVVRTSAGMLRSAVTMAEAGGWVMTSPVSVQNGMHCVSMRRTRAEDRVHGHTAPETRLGSDPPRLVGG